MNFHDTPEVEEVPESEITHVIDGWLSDFERVDEYCIALPDERYLAASLAIAKNDPDALMAAYRDGLREAMRADAIKHLEEMEVEA